MNSTTAHRETWLNQLATMMAPKFEELGHPLPAFRVSIGFTGSPKESKVAGVVYHKVQSADGRFEVFISPDQAEPMQVAAILAHELTHAAVGFNHKHKGLFATTVAKLGMVRPFTSSVAGDAFKAWAQPFLDALGPLPHAPLHFRRGERPAGGAGGEDGGEGEGEDGGSSNDKKKQSTRLLKAACKHSSLAGVNGEQKVCGYTVRLSKKWALQLGACCPVHGPMEIEGLDAAEPEDGEGEGE